MSDTRRTKRKKRRSLTGSGAGHETVAVLAEGRLLAGRFRIVEKIGTGGMGVVYKVKDEKLEGRVFALKALPPDMAKSSAAIKRLKKEALAAIELHHPNIMALHSFESDGQYSFLIMEYLDGQDLENALVDKDRFSCDEMLEVARCVCPALDYAHKKGVVHRDIKPGNLLYTSEGDARVVKVADFGIAYQVRNSIARITGQDTTGGTMHYMSPEQLAGRETDARSDQYSLAATLYELLRGRPPFEGSGGMLIHQIETKAPEPLDDVPEHVNAALLKALAKNPDERFASCGDLLAALEGRLAVAGGADDAGLTGTTGGEAGSSAGSTTDSTIEPTNAMAATTTLAGKPLSSWIFTGLIGLVLLFFISFALGLGSIFLSIYHGVATSSNSSPRNSKDQIVVSGERDGAKGHSVAVGQRVAAGGKSVVSLQRMPVDQQSMGQNSRGIPSVWRNRSSGVGVSTASPQGWSAPGMKKNTHGIIRITVAPSDAKVMIDKYFVSLSKYSGIVRPPGSYVLSASRKGYRPTRKTVTLRGGEEVDVILKLEKTAFQSRIEKDFDMPFVWIPPGEFTMGSPSGERERRSSEGPRHRVRITRGFWLGKYEVTQNEWQAVMCDNPSEFKGSSLPVERVSWDDCQVFIRKLNAKRTGSRYRLPTEAEWEYACRAGTKTPFYFGENISVDQVNYNGDFPYAGGRRGRYRRRTTRVGSFPPNPWGLYDMHGNVWEWCSDWYDGSYYKEGIVTDPRGPGSGSFRVNRGAGWDSSAKECRAAYRHCDRPGHRSHSMGLRLVLEDTAP